MDVSRQEELASAFLTPLRFEMLDDISPPHDAIYDMRGGDAASTAISHNSERRRACFSPRHLPGATPYH